MTAMATAPSERGIRERTLWLTGWAARLGTAAVFVAAAVPKILDPGQFAEDISNYQAFPYWSWNFLAGTVAALELTAGLALLIPRTRRASAILLGALTLGFLALILSVIVRGIDTQCGCFSQPSAPGAATVGWPLFFRDLALLAVVGCSGWLGGPKQAQSS